MHFRFSSVMPVQASQSVVEPEGLYQNIIGFSDLLFGSTPVIGSSAFDPFSQLHQYPEEAESDGGDESV